MTDALTRSKVVRHVLISSLSNYIGKFINLATWFILTPFILKQLGEAIYGLWTLVSSVVAYGYLLDFGITEAVTKYVAEYRTRGEGERASDIIATGLWTNAGVGLLIILASMLLAPLFTGVFDIPPAKQEMALLLFRLAGATVGISLPCATTTAVLRGLQRFDLINLTVVTATLSTAAGTILVLFLGAGVVGLAYVGLVTTLLVQVMSIWFVYRIAPELRYGRLALDSSHLKVLFTYSSSLFIMNLGGYLESKSDELVIGRFLPISAVTPYSLARRLSTLPQMITEQFLTLLLPMASELNAKEDRAQLRSLYVVSTRVTLAIFLSMSMALIVLVKPLLNAWVGADYVSYSSLVVVLVLASLIDTSTWPAGFVLQGIARHAPLAAMTIGSGIANITLSILLVSRFGLLGVALGTLIPTTIVCLGFVIPYAMRVIGTSAREMYAKVLWPSAFPLIPMSIVMIILREILHPASLIMILTIAGLGPLVYLVVYLRIEVNEFERTVVNKIVKESVARVRFYSKPAERG